MKELDTDRIHREWDKHLEHWMAGDIGLRSVPEFLAEKIAEQLVEQFLAENGIVLA